ncbi:hypothetical protein G6F56_004116 [Rhizopus delemar]|nr:hypothetical protein G6F56_004116 [Rhizopus delemar]
MLGGPGMDHVQIHESKFGKRKYRRGHRVEGVWILGLVEAIYLGPTSVRERQQDGTYSTRVVEKHKAERRFLCTLPNRIARTLIPIIRKYALPGTTIRTDGWRAYSGLHQGMWNRVKKDLSARHRTKKECPYRLVEYLWHYENRNNIWNALARRFDHYQLITEETESGDFLDGDPTEEMDEMHAIDIQLDDSSDSGSEAGSQNDLDYNPEIRSEPRRAIRRVTRSRRAVVVIEN